MRTQPLSEMHVLLESVCVWAACLSCQNVLIRLTADPNQGKERRRAGDRGNTSKQNAERVPMNGRGEKVRWVEK